MTPTAPLAPVRLDFGGTISIQELREMIGHFYNADRGKTAFNALRGLLDEIERLRRSPTPGGGEGGMKTLRARIADLEKVASIAALRIDPGDVPDEEWDLIGKVLGANADATASPSAPGVLQQDLPTPVVPRLTEERRGFLQLVHGRQQHDWEKAAGAVALDHRFSRGQAEGEEMIAPDVGTWRTRADYDAWSRGNMVAFNRLAVTDFPEWERTAKKIEAFLARMKKAELA